MRLDLCNDQVRGRPERRSEHGPRETIALAHGAGTAMDTPFLPIFAEGLAAVGFCGVRFEFPYMAQSRQTDKQRPPDHEPVLRETWMSVIE